MDIGMDIISIVMPAYVY